MLRRIRSLCVLACVSSLFLVSEAQFFDTAAASLGNAPVGFISRVGAFGDRETYSSFGNAPVGVYQMQQYAPRPWYPAPVRAHIQVYPPVKPPMPPRPRPPPKPLVRPPPRPIVLPPVRPPCQLPGSCKPKPVRPIVRPPIRPGVRPPKRPGRPYRKPSPKITKGPQPYGPRPGGVSGRGGLLGGLLGGGGLGSILGR